MCYVGAPMSMRSSMGSRCGAVVVLLGSTTILATGLATVRPAQAEVPWFDQIQTAPALPPATLDELARYVAGAVNGREADVPVAVDGAGDAARLNAARLVFVSVSDAENPAIVGLGAGRGVRQATANAIASVRERCGPGCRATWTKVDVATDVVSHPQVNIRRRLPFDPRVFGLAFSQQPGAAFLPEELVALGLVDGHGKLRRDTLRAHPGAARARAAADALFGATEVPLHGFSTQGVFSDGEAVIPLSRGHRRLGAIGPRDLEAAIRDAGRYLVRVVQPDGRFIYIYNARSARTPRGYNILRHAGTVYSMMEVYAHTRDPAVLEAGQRALTYLLGTLQPCQTRSGPARCVVEHGETKLGGNALAIVALAQYAAATGDRQHLPVMQALARWITGAQERDGRFVVHKMRADGLAWPFASGYYPGQAILALSRLYGFDRNQAWLQSAVSAARYLILTRDAKLSDEQLAHDHWLLYGLSALQRHRPDPLWITHARRLTRVIREAQHREGVDADWVGGFGRPPRSTPTAVRSEGLCAVYPMLRAAGHSKDSEAIRAALWAAARFQLLTQLTPESAMYLPQAQRGLGGFRDSLTGFEIRIDYVQHNLSALLCLLGIDPPTA